MSKLKRYFEKGNRYFVTVVTNQRKPILINNYNIFEKAITRIKKKHNFEIIAFVVIPDHFHMIINPLDDNLSQIIHDIKLSFNAQFRKVNNQYRGQLWQSRYWDHIFRDQDDMNRHIDYIHYNPVKHGLAKSPFDWGMSSINKYKKDGYYQDDWGVKDKVDIDGDFGE